MGLFSFLFTNHTKDALARGAAIIDVRTAREYDEEGRVKASHNIPVDRIRINMDRVRALGPLIVVCGSGDSRNGQAVSILRQAGVKEVIDGGRWERVLRLRRQV